MTAIEDRYPLDGPGPDARGDRIRWLAARADEGIGDYTEFDELVADRNEDIVQAASAMADVAGEALCEAAASFTCDEAEAINDLLVALGSAWAPDFREHHAAGDDDEGDQHAGGWAA